MKKLVIVVFLCATANLLAQSPTETYLLELSRKKFEWLIAKNADSIQVTFDDRIQYVHSNGWIQSKQEVLDDMKSGRLVYQQVTVKEAMVRVYGNAAVVTGLGTFEGINSGTAFKLDLRYTEVYVKTRTRWMLASRHSNRMP